MSLPATSPPPAAPGTTIAAERVACARFLTQATMGPSYADIEALRTSPGPLNKRFNDWITLELKKPAPPRHHTFDTYTSRRKIKREPITLQHQLLDSSLMGDFIEQGGLRMRMAFALSEIFVMSPESMHQVPAAANYWDILVRNAFGNYRTLLEEICLSPAMGVYLTYVNNRKADPEKGTLPDENFAREILQLFSIGLVKLRQDGKPAGGRNAPETYTQDDIMGLASVFTGWVVDQRQGKYITPIPENGIEGNPRPHRLPMIQNPLLHESGPKTFLGMTIPAGTNGEQSLKLALDHIFNHENVPPFICKQLIQRLVKSNPSPAYVHAVAAKFKDNGKRVRGDLSAVLRAILTHKEAQTPGVGGGKLREPVLRFTHWARAFNASCRGDAKMAGEWLLGDMTDSARRLGQSPMQAPSVFNFFRPGYVPTGTPIAAAGMVAPEFQIVDEVSLAGYLNFMRMAIENRWRSRVNGADKLLIKADYSDYLPLAKNDLRGLFDRLNLVLACGQISKATGDKIVAALASIPSDTLPRTELRVQAAVLLVMASPEYIAIA